MTTATKPAKAISFNGPMVRAILDGRKTMTRRPVKLAERGQVTYLGDGRLWPHEPMPDDRHSPRPALPPHQPGDRLWVREKARVVETALWATTARGGMRVRLRYEADGALSDWLPYPARLKPVQVGKCIPNGCYREAARTFLEVTKVRVERLQDISEADAIAEGIEPLFSSDDVRDSPECRLNPMPWTNYLWHGRAGVAPSLSRQWAHQHSSYANARDSFSSLWSSIYGPDAWDRNDWVWVVEFRRVAS